jgi:hypothetical protein
VTEPAEPPSPIGWGRAVVSTLVILAVGAAALVFLPNWVLVHLTGISRNARVAIATVGFLAAFVIVAWALRRLQARGTI